jgi:hypothetical protein
MLTAAPRSAHARRVTARSAIALSIAAHYGGAVLRTERTGG